MYDVSGRLVKKEILNNIENSIDISQLVSGMYVLKFTSRKGNASSKIVVK